MRYYQNHVLPLTIATLTDALYSEAAEITPQPCSAIKAKSTVTFTAMQESTCHKKTEVTAPHSEAVVNDIPLTMTARNHRVLNRRLPTEEADFFRKLPEAVLARIAQMADGLRNLNALRSEGAQ